MCGINGIVKLNKKKVFQKEIDLMNQSIKHRGPDDQGIFVDGSVGFGHLRLAILDLSPKGHQPMIYKHKKQEIVIVFNGEIYNFEEIREKLKEKGYKFNSTSDTEVLEAAYLEYGFRCVEEFNGMFAFVIYDKKKNILFGARDRLGKKPLKYYLDKERFIFSSELKAILTQGIKREVDLEAVNDYLTLQYVPAPKTGFKNIFKLPQASYFVFDLEEQKLEIEKYWDLDYSKKINWSETKLIKELEKRLDQSVKRRMIADVEIGAFLSGGVDSSAVVAFASKYKKQLKTFTIKFDEKDFDESEYAKIVAKKYQTDHREFLVKPGDMKDLIEDLVVQYEEPYADSSQLPTFILSQKTSEHVKVVLNGDGGDENFAGYDKYWFHLLANCLEKIPNANRISKSLSGNKKLFASLLKEDSIIRRHFNFTNYFDIFSKEDFYKEKYRDEFEDIHYQSFENVLKKDKFKKLDNIFYLDFHTYVPDDLMVKVDIATMANGLESRSPILDYELVEFCAQIVQNRKVDVFGRRKKIFKKMLEKYLPKDILYRKKKGFAIPIKHWFRDELKDYVKEVILREGGLVLELMKKEKVEKLIDDHQRGTDDHSKKLWSLMVLNLWYEKCFL